MRQKQALAVMMTGANVFLTGAPGAGKTYVLNEFVRRAQADGKRVAVTASTGIAASHLGGTTIHSWSGLGILDSLSHDDIKRIGGNDRLRKRYNATDVLVIDEISMLHGYRLDMINQVAKLLRDSKEAFGGMQVILVGDLFQLPPVSRGQQGLDFVHLSSAWEELELRICYITEQHRQVNNDGLLDLLEAMRRGQLEDVHEELLREHIGREPNNDVVLTRLFAHNVDVESINQRHLGAIEQSSQTYQMFTKGNKHKLEQLVKSVLAPEVLELKQGAEVMFVANNFSEGFVNGSRGRVVDFNGDTPVVEMLNGRFIEVLPHSWSLSEDGRVLAEVSQLPLRLAWAITIHKSQGMSLDAAQIDLSRAFTPGMGYVALSRVRSLQGLYLQGVNQTALVMHPQVFALDADLRIASDELAAVTEDIGEEVISEASPTSVDDVLLRKLKDWRMHRAGKDSVPAYIIAHNAALEAVASIKPRAVQQLMGVPGFGAKKVEKYGDDIISVVVEHLKD